MRLYIDSAYLSLIVRVLDRVLKGIYLDTNIIGISIRKLKTAAI